jgi:hypothetical protein
MCQREKSQSKTFLNHYLVIADSIQNVIFTSEYHQLCGNGSTANAELVPMMRMRNRDREIE